MKLGGGSQMYRIVEAWKVRSSVKRCVLEFWSFGRRVWWFLRVWGVSKSSAAVILGEH